MQRTKLLVLLLAGLTLLVATAAATAAGPERKAWKIALTSNRQGDSEVYSVNANGSGARRLTRTRGFDGGGAFSPDGRKVLIYSRAPRGHPGDVVVVNADGSGRRNLTRHPAFDAPGGWSPDGRRIVFTSNRDGNEELYVMGADGSGQRILSPSPSSDDYASGWSPDGRTILFTSDRTGNWEVFAVNADGSNARNLTRSPGSDGHEGGALWSRDGSRIFFSSTRDTRDQDHPELYVMNADGSAVRRLTRTPGVEGVMSQSPDGRRLAFWRYPVKPRWAFFVMNVDGSGMRKVNWALPRR